MSQCLSSCLCQNATQSFQVARRSALPLAWCVTCQVESATSGVVGYLLLEALPLLLQYACDVVALGRVLRVPPLLLLQVRNDLP